jgi:UDP-N-acetylmuramoylalanine--D-glutamate ligase
MGGNIGTAILSLEPPRMGRVHVVEMSSYQIDLAPSLDPSVGILLNVSEDHIDRHGTLQHYAAVKARLVAGVQPQGTSIVGVDDGWCRNIADRLDQAGKRVVRISVKNPLPDGVMRARNHCPRGRARSEIAKPADRTPLRACIMRRMRPARRLARWRWHLDHAAKRPAQFRGLQRMEQVGRRGGCAGSTDPRAPMPCGAHAKRHSRHLWDRRK